MISNSMEQNDWKVQPDNTIQVVDPMGIQKDDMSAKKNWRGVLIALGIIAFVLLMVTTAVLILGPMQIPPFYGRRLLIEDLKNPSLKPMTSHAHWVAGDKVVYMSEFGGIRLLDINKKINTTLVTYIAVHQSGATDFSSSPNLRYVLLVHNVRQGRFDTSTARYSIYDVESDHYFPLKLRRQDVDHPRYQHASWVGQRGAALLVVDRADLFYFTDPTSRPRRLTQSARTDTFFNGVPDLLYEELLGGRKAIWSNWDGTCIAVASFNDSEVNQLPVLSYSSSRYPSVVTLRYPDIDSRIPSVEVWVYNVTEDLFPPMMTRLLPPQPISGEHYLVDVGWVTDTHIWVSWKSRDHSTAILASCEAPEWDCEVVHNNHKESGVSPAVRGVVWAEPWAAFPWAARTLEGAWHQHVALVARRGARHAPVALEKYHVDRVLGYDRAENVVYFLGSNITKSPGLQHLYVVSTLDENVRCISCVLPQQEGLGCETVSAEVNLNMTHAIVFCKGVYPPSTHLVPLQEDHDGTLALHKQTSLREALHDLALPVRHAVDVSLAPALHAAVTMTLPPGWFPEDPTNLYPLVVQMVGPGQEEVPNDSESWHLGWPEFLASGHQVAHALVRLWGADPSTRASVHTLAQYHTKIIQKLLEDHHYLDKNNVAVWGEGVGAALALDAFAYDQDLIKCAALISPITDWRGYGSYWSERLLGTVSSDGMSRRYEDSDARRLASLLPDHRILLAHGTLDPSAHQSFLLAHSLTKESVHFKHLVYTEESRTIENHRHHLITALSAFLFSPSCLHDPLIYEEERG
ncbi:inactive dipeptidyl peptidase 10-like isoform X2 [Oratosquilla oratoria]|uniref:inactive dipeptidyl peptidase 10-like isoform X2 n=1 Tax=Oratosquilla oratoria TaxID=337810 RepID=UPI003F76568F